MYVVPLTIKFESVAQLSPVICTLDSVPPAIDTLLKSVDSPLIAESMYARSAAELAAIANFTFVISPVDAAPSISITLNSTLPVLPATE